MADRRNIVVYGEIADGHVAGITKELLGGARSLADKLGEDLIVVFVGDGVTGPAREAGAFGCSRQRLFFLLVKDQLRHLTSQPDSILDWRGGNESSASSSVKPLGC